MHRWTEPQLTYISENAHRFHDAVIAAKLSMIYGKIFTMESVRSTRQRMGIRKARGRHSCEVVKRPLGRGGVGLTIKGEDPE